MAPETGGLVGCAQHRDFARKLKMTCRRAAP
jgi:hypothetical protein